LYLNQQNTFFKYHSASFCITRIVEMDRESVSREEKDRKTETKQEIDIETHYLSYALH
jgi:hypothetical protein